MPPMPTIARVVALLLPLLTLPATAQGIDVGIDLGGVGVGGGVSVDLGTGGVGAGSSPGDGAPTEATILTQAAALDAVTSRKALPLDQILPAARLATTGDIIDANLIALGGFLLYEFKVLERSGDVSALYFYARSGAMVEIK